MKRFKLYRKLKGGCWAKLPSSGWTLIKYPTSSFIIKASRRGIVFENWNNK